MNVNQITNKLNSFFSKIDNKITKVMPVPILLLLCAAAGSPGLSTLKSLSNVCQAFEGLGIPTGPNPDGSPNLVVKMSYAILNEVYRAIQEDAQIQGGANIGSMTIQSTGSGGVSIGTNILPVKITGKIF